MDVEKTSSLGKRFEYDHKYFEKPLKLHSIDLYQIGELCCEDGYVIEPHAQNSIEISYIVTGEGTFVTDGRECTVRQSDVYINRLGQMHTIRADRGTPLRYFYFAFRFRGDTPFPQGLCNFYTDGAACLLHGEGKLFDDYSDFFDELHSRDDFFEIMLENCALRLIVNTYRAFMHKHPDGMLPVNENNLGGTVYTVIRMIDQNYRSISSVHSLAQELGYSYTYLAHVFQKKMNITIGRYVLLKKMEKARELLQTGRLNVTQVSQWLGYSSVQSFSDNFKKVYGILPTEYLRQLQKTLMG